MRQSFIISILWIPGLCLSMLWEADSGHVLVPRAPPQSGGSRDPKTGESSGGTWSSSPGGATHSDSSRSLPTKGRRRERDKTWSPTAESASKGPNKSRTSSQKLPEIPSSQSGFRPLIPSALLLGTSGVDPSLQWGASFGSLSPPRRSGGPPRSLGGLQQLPQWGISNEQHSAKRVRKGTHGRMQGQALADSQRFLSPDRNMAEGIQRLRSSSARLDAGSQGTRESSPSFSESRGQHRTIPQARTGPSFTDLLGGSIDRPPSIPQIPSIELMPPPPPRLPEQHAATGAIPLRQHPSLENYRSQLLSTSAGNNQLINTYLQSVHEIVHNHYTELNAQQQRYSQELSELQLQRQTQVDNFLTHVMPQMQAAGQNRNIQPPPGRNTQGRP